MEKKVKKIPVYDLDAKYGVQERITPDGKHIKIGVGSEDEDVAVVQGPKGVLVFCEEGIGYKLHSMDGDYEVGMMEVDDQGHRVFPRAAFNITQPIREVISGAPTHEVEIKDFVRRFGARLEGNFYEMLRALDEIGLDRNEYYIEGTR